MALVTIGRVALLQQKVHAALNRFEEGLVLARRQQDELAETIALHHLGWAELLLGEPAKAGPAFTESLETSARLRHDEGIAYGLEGLVALAALAGDEQRAGLLLGAAQTLRKRTGLYNAPAFSFHQPLVEQMLEGGGPDVVPDADGVAPAEGPVAAPAVTPASRERFEAALAEGRELTTDAAVVIALAVATEVGAGAGGDHG